MKKELGDCTNRLSLCFLFSSSAGGFSKSISFWRTWEAKNQATRPMEIRFSVYETKEEEKKSSELVNWAQIKKRPFTIPTEGADSTEIANPTEISGKVRLSARRIQKARTADHTRGGEPIAFKAFKGHILTVRSDAMGDRYRSFKASPWHLGQTELRAEMVNLRRPILGQLGRSSPSGQAEGRRNHTGGTIEASLLSERPEAGERGWRSGRSS